MVHLLGGHVYWSLGTLQLRTMLGYSDTCNTRTAVLMPTETIFLIAFVVMHLFAMLCVSYLAIST